MDPQTFHRRQSQMKAVLQESTETLSLSVGSYVPQLNDFVLQLKKLLVSAERNRKNCLIAKTTGTSVGGVGAILAIVGAVAAPFTAGISLAVASSIGAGFVIAFAGSTTSIGTSIADSCIERQNTKDVEKLWQRFSEIESNMMTQSDKMIESIIRLDDLDL